MRAFFIALAFAASFSVSAKDSDCEELLRVESEMSKKLPFSVDEVTSVVELSVNCTTRIVKYVKHLSVEKSQLAEGFAERKQRQYVNLHCNNQGLATRGWNAVDYVYDNIINPVS